jgi:hypothetical protein
MSEAQTPNMDSPESERPVERPEEMRDERVTRRTFLRRAASAGGLTMLGLMGAEAILPAVLRRADVLARNQGLASEIAARLRRSVVMSADASIDACVPGDYSSWCSPLQNFTCSTAEYDDCPGTVKHNCANFICAQPFNCDAIFNCGGPAYRCDSDNFQCSGSDYYCPQAVDCGSGADIDPYTCPPNTIYHPPSC